jgi:SAM-dependent methyltransferase
MNPLTGVSSRAVASAEPFPIAQIPDTQHLDPSSFQEERFRISFEKYFRKIGEAYEAQHDFSSILRLGSLFFHCSDRKILDCVRMKLTEIHSFQQVFQARTPLGQMLFESQKGQEGSLLPIETVSQGTKESSDLLPRIMREWRAHSLDHLNRLSTTEIWDLMLKNQVQMQFDLEFLQIAKWTWWQEAINILEIGSGNGTYLHKCSCQFPEKIFRGVEKRPQYVWKAQEQYSRTNIVFHEGDAEVCDRQLIGSSDVVLFRLVLQYLNNPTLALQNAAKYLKSGGYVVIIDSCDSAVRTSHPLPTCIEAVQELTKVQERERQMGNRRVTLALLQELEMKDSPLSELYEVAFTNLDRNGEVLRDFVRVEGNQNALYFNQVLLFSQLMGRNWHIPIDLNKVFDETVGYLNDDTAWSLMGLHLLIFKKR